MRYTHFGSNCKEVYYDKSLDYSYLTISQSTASLLKTVMIGLFPLAYLAIGIVVVVGRRKKKYEAV